jgi:hypothetical protein
MEQHARMFKVITSLVVAMTATAALLIWVEPSRTTAQSLVPILAAEQAERVVTQDVDVSHGRWCQIDVAVCNDLTVARTNTLAAIAPVADRFHFIVGANGWVRATAAWQRQAAIGQPPDVVRIGVACDAREHNLTTSQRTALEALLVELYDRCAPPNGWRTASVDDEDGRTDGPTRVLRGIVAGLSPAV